MPVSAILLAAGESTRMGQLKALLPWRGATLLEYQLQELSAAPIEEIVVVLGHQSPELLPLVKHPKAKAVINPQYQSGKVGSIKAGAQTVSPAAEAIMIIGVDEPRPREILAALIQEHLQAKALITVPSYRGKHGHPPILARELLSELMALSEEKQGLREIMQRYRSGIHEVDADSPLVLLNINSLEDYERAVASFEDYEAAKSQ